MLADSGHKRHSHTKMPDNSVASLLSSVGDMRREVRSFLSAIDAEGKG